MKIKTTGRLKSSSNFITFIGERTGNLYGYIRYNSHYKQVGDSKSDTKKTVLIDTLDFAMFKLRVAVIDLVDGIKNALNRR